MLVELWSTEANFDQSSFPRTTITPAGSPALQTHLLPSNGPAQLLTSCWPWLFSCRTLPTEHLKMTATNIWINHMGSPSACCDLSPVTLHSPYFIHVIDWSLQCLQQYRWGTYRPPVVTFHLCVCNCFSSQGGYDFRRSATGCCGPLGLCVISQ